MAARGSPDWLPSGWTVQYRVQKTGRKIRIYKDMESGKSFYSKDDVIGYVRSKKRQKPIPTSRRVKTQSGNSPVQLVVKANERPEWLPDGWKVESRTRMSGSLVGSPYKCYVDPMTGNRFYSKPEVFRYLRTAKNRLCTLKERRTSNHTSSRSQVVIEHYKDDDLPPGWIKEIKIREKADGFRKDPFYIDPKTGYVFRSKKEVFRYLETGDIGRHAFKPKEGGDGGLELIGDKLSEHYTAEGQKQEYSAETPQFVQGKEIAKGSNLEPLGDQFPQTGKCVNESAKLKDAIVPPVETVEDIVLSPEVVKNSSEINEKNSRTATLPTAEHPESNITVRINPDSALVSTSVSESHRKEALLKTESPTSAFESLQEKALPKAENPESNKIVVSPDSSPLSTSVTKLQQENTIGDMNGKSDIGESKIKKRKYKKKKDVNLPRRSSKRLAGIEPELERNAETRKVPPQVSNEGCFSGVSPDAGLLNVNADKACQQLDARPQRENEGHVSNFMESTLPVNTSNKWKTPVGCSLDAPEEQILRVQTEKMDDAGTEAQLCIPIAEFWSDPCLEFAIKTLTGALPVENTTATDGSVSCPTVDSLQEKSSQKRGSRSCMNKKSEVKRQVKKKKEVILNRQSPSINGIKPELASGMMSYGQANLNSDEAIFSINFAEGGRLNGEPACMNEQCQTSWKTGPLRELEHHPPQDLNTEQSNKITETQEHQMILEDQLQKLPAKDHATLDASLSFPFGDSWSDPCLDFAFKTLTGVIPIEDSLGIQSYFEERLETSRSQKDGNLALPDFGSTSFFQNDISSHFDGPEKSVSGQHLSLDPFLPMDNVSLPNCSGFTSQQSCLDRNRTFKGR